MQATYLRVKNWSCKQHYSDRRPPWIKLYNDLLEDDVFMRLDEFEQWQLVRIWMVASKSSALTLDESGARVPAVANDATSLQRSIASVKKVPLAKLIREGWLIPVEEDELVPPDEVTKAKRRRGASKVASTAASTTSPSERDGASATLRSREAEGSEVLVQDPGRQFGERAAGDLVTEGLPFENTFLTARLMQLIGQHADPGTATVVRSYASKLPPASLTKVIESIDHNDPSNRAAYAVGALKRELDERVA